MSVKMSNPRVLRTGRPLALEAIRTVAPAVFANEAHESRGPRYMYVPTIEPLQRMLDSGWGVWEARQQRSRDGARDPYTKHMLRLRKLEDFDRKAIVGDGVPEVVLINAHDGTAAYHLNAGYFRFICSNGMMVGKTLAGFKVLHTQSSKTSMEVLKAGESVITEKFPVMLAQRERMMQVEVTRDNQYKLAQRAMHLRYGTMVAPFPVDDLLRCRRPEDEQPTVWNILNRIQENVLGGGWETRSQWGRRSAVRPVERVSAVATINAGLWDAALELAE